MPRESMEQSSYFNGMSEDVQTGVVHYHRTATLDEGKVVRIKYRLDKEGWPIIEDTKPMKRRDPKIPTEKIPNHKNIHHESSHIDPIFGKGQLTPVVR